jgi:hypothetical protein
MNVLLLVQLCIQLSRFAADMLELIPKPSTPQNAPIQFLARGEHWQLLSDPFAVEEVFALAMFSFEECWERCTEVRQQLPSTEMYHDCLVYALDTIQRMLLLGPHSVENMWELWVADKVSMINAANAKAGHVKHVDSSAAVPNPSSSHSSSTAGLPNSPLSGASESSTASPAAVGSDDGSPEQRVRRANSDDKDRSSHSSSYGDDPVVGDATFHDDTMYSTTPVLTDVPKSLSGVKSTVVGGSNILAPIHIRQLEAALPKEYQCMNWKQVFRMTRDGANITTLRRLSKKSKLMLMVIKDSLGCVFGALVFNVVRSLVKSI